MHLLKSIIVFAAVVALAGTMPACAGKAWYRAQIDKKGIPYTADSFFNSIAANDTAVTELFLGSGFDANACRPAKSPEGMNETAMTLALNDGDLATARLLLKYGYQLNTEKCSIKDPPLHYAAMRGMVEVAKLLVENGADVNRKDQFGLTPLALARSMRHPEVAAFLESKGAK